MGALKQVDNRLQRASLARAVLALVENKAIGTAVADAAIVDLDSHDTSSLLRTQPAQFDLGLRRSQPDPFRSTSRLPLIPGTQPPQSGHTPSC